MGTALFQATRVQTSVPHWVASSGTDSENGKEPLRFLTVSHGPQNTPASSSLGPVILISSIAKGILWVSLGCGLKGGKILLDYFSGPPVELGLPRWLSGRDPTCQCRRCRRLGFCPWVGKIPWRRKWQPTPVFLPGKSHGQRSLAGYSPWGCQKLDMTEPLSMHTNRAKRVLKSEREGQEKQPPAAGSREETVMCWGEVRTTPEDGKGERSAPGPSVGPRHCCPLDCHLREPTVDF